MCTRILYRISRRFCQRFYQIEMKNIFSVDSCYSPQHPFRKIVGFCPVHRDSASPINIFFKRFRSQTFTFPNRPTRSDVQQYYNMNLPATDSRLKLVISRYVLRPAIARSVGCAATSVFRTFDFDVENSRFYDAKNRAQRAWVLLLCTRALFYIDVVDHISAPRSRDHSYRFVRLSHARALSALLERLLIPILIMVIFVSRSIESVGWWGNTRPAGVLSYRPGPRPGSERY